MSKVIYHNPVVKGCYPDPSVCRVGNDFYLVNSTFEFFPGVPVLHSTDLVHWKTIGHCISRVGQLELAPGEQSHSGIYAPSIRYKDGIFYMITTNVGNSSQNGNFYMYTKDPAGEWSDPIFLGTPGIDPSLFFDDDGKDWYVGTCSEGIYIQEIDLIAGKVLGERTVLWHGTGGAYPEGPHIYKKNGWYYLMISEGGTERCHMLTMAKSRELCGSYHAYEGNPVMTNRSLGLPIQSVGHADLVEDQYGNWWAVCLGTRTFAYPPRHNLGRETMLIPVDFSGDWPVFGENGQVLDEFSVSALPGMNGGEDEVDHYATSFENKQLDLSWNGIYALDNSLVCAGDGRLELYGNSRKLSDADQIAWIGRRQQHHNSSTKVKLTFPCTQEGEEAGLTIFTNNLHHYDAALMYIDGKRNLIFRRQIGSLWKIEKEIPLAEDTVQLILESNLNFYTFFYIDEHDEKKELGRGETGYLTTEVGGAFTGNYIGLYSVGNGKKCITKAEFREFHYDVIIN